MKKKQINIQIIKVTFNLLTFSKEIGTYDKDERTGYFDG